MTATDARGAIVARIEAAGVVAVIRTSDPSKLAPLFAALADGGVAAIEITTTVPEPFKAIARAARQMPADVLVGAGTVLDPETAKRAVAAGAVFIVSPVASTAIVEAAQALGAAAIPGCFSPTEIWTAWQTGADAVKVFPATSLGPQYVRDLRAPLPQLRLVPTGGVSLENAGAWIRAGAMAVGVGTALVDTAAVARADWTAISRRARHFVDAVAEARR